MLASVHFVLTMSSCSSALPNRDYRVGYIVREASDPQPLRGWRLLPWNTCGETQGLFMSYSCYALIVAASRRALYLVRFGRIWSDLVPVAAPILVAAVEPFGQVH